MITRERHGERGQVIAVFGALAIVFLLVTALVIDGGQAFVQRRSAQNASDLAALAAVRVMASGGTDAEVVAIITATALANRGTVSFVGGQRPVYLNSASVVTGPVGSGTIPARSVGVRVPASITWQTQIARVVGISTWTASTTATARYKSPVANGGVFPFAISASSFDQTQAGHFTLCPPDDEPVSRGGTCPDEGLNDDGNSQNFPGSFGWLKFGATGRCSGYGLGMSTTSGCPNGAASGFLQGEIDGNSYGCCDAPTGGAAPADRIAGYQGHNGNGGNDCSVPIASEQTYIIPVWDTGGGNGNSAYYHIIGFAGFQITQCSGANSAQGVWRLPLFPGPTNQIPNPPGTSVSVRLLK